MLYIFSIASKRIYFLISAIIIALVVIIAYQHRSSLVATRHVKGICEQSDSARIIGYCNQKGDFKGKALRLMPIGDSITLGPLNTNSYRAQLLELLAGNDVEMVGSGLWGTMKPISNNALEANADWTLQDITATAQVSCAKHNPNVILLHAGTNEIMADLELDGIRSHLIDLLDTLAVQCPNATIYVAQVVPCAFRDEQIRQFNAMLVQEVRKRANNGMLVMSVDMHSHFGPADMADVIHPSESGYAKMAQRWHQALRKANHKDWI